MASAGPCAGLRRVRRSAGVRVLTGGLRDRAGADTVEVCCLPPVSRPLPASAASTSRPARARTGRAAARREGEDAPGGRRAAPATGPAPAGRSPAGGCAATRSRPGLPETDAPGSSGAGGAERHRAPAPGLLLGRVPSRDRVARARSSIRIWSRGGGVRPGGFRGLVVAGGDAAPGFQRVDQAPDGVPGLSADTARCIPTPHQSVASAPQKTICQNKRRPAVGNPSGAA